MWCSPSSSRVSDTSRSYSADGPTEQIARAKEIKAHFLQKQAVEMKDKRALAEKRASGVIVSLGLVNADADADSTGGDKS